MQGAEKGQAVNLDGRVMHVGIVQARFNDALTGQMAKICIEELIAAGSARCLAGHGRERQLRCLDCVGLHHPG